MESFTQYKDLVKLTLEMEYDLRLEGEKKIEYFNDFIIVDLHDANKGFYIEIVPNQKSLDFSSLERRVYEQNKIVVLNSKASLITQIIVFSNNISKDDKISVWNNLLGNLTNTTVFIYDKQDIEKLAHKNSIDIQAFNNTDTPKEINPIKNYSAFDNTNLFLGGHLWGNEDQLERFIQNGIWENGHETNDVNAVNNARQGDFVLLKSAYTQNGKSMLRLKALGEVVENKLDGHTLIINWSLFQKHINIPELGKYRRTFQQVTQPDRDTILDALFEGLPNHSLDQLVNNNKTYEKIVIGEEMEIPVDEEQSIFFSQQIESKIREYNVFFLFVTYSADDTFILNNTTENVLEKLKVNFDVIQAKIENFVKNQLLWVYVKRNDSSHHICFILLPEKIKRTNAVENILNDAINEYGKSLNLEQSLIGDKKVFISIADLEKNNLSPVDFFDKVIDSITPLKRSIINPKKIRINLPDYFDNYDIDQYKNSLLEKVNLRSFQPNKERTKDKIPFHLDNVETVDKLNREPVAKSFARLVNEDIFDQEEMNHSFMVHLQGEWGSGKSTFLNLIEKHLNTDTRKWIVIHYNAWQNQHISPPWWSFIDQVYRQGKQKLHWFTQRPRLWGQEKLRRWIWYSAWQKIISFVIFIFLLLVISLNYNAVLESIGVFAKLGEKSTNADILKFILSAGSIIGIVFSLAKFISTPFAMRNAEQAKRFTLRASDPMNRIKEHFNSLIEDFRKQEFEIAIFIDDIDRCNSSYTVELLEGIQTLFKEKRVLYIVASDTKWITSCFENNYKEFIENISKKEQNLGELFLEKAFQLSIRMPEVSEESKELYWNEIIGDTLEIEVEIDVPENVMSLEQREKIKNRLIHNYNQNDNSPETINDIKEEFQLSNKQATDITIEALDQDTQDVRHLLKTFYKQLNPNPRSIKRLANNYTMYRNILIAEGADFKPNHLFRWLLLEDKYPVLRMHLMEVNDLESKNQILENLGYTEVEKNDINKIVQGEEENDESVLKISELLQIFKK